MQLGKNVAIFHWEWGQNLATQEWQIKPGGPERYRKKRTYVKKKQYRVMKSVKNSESWNPVVDLIASSCSNTITSNSRPVHGTETKESRESYTGFVCLFCCFMSQVNSYGHGGTLSLHNHSFSWASLNKRLTYTSCTYFRL